MATYAPTRSVATSFGVTALASLGLLAALGSAPARAQSDTTVIFPAVGAAKIKDRHLKRAANSISTSADTLDGASLAATALHTASETSASSCAVDAACLAGAGAKLGATRVVGVLVAPAKSKFAITLVLADVATGEELARANETIDKAELENRPGDLLAELLAAAPAPAPVATDGGNAATAEPSAPDAATADAANPWAEGVTPEQEQTALAIFNEGNGFFEQSKYSQALAKYREAIKVWDHPAIRFNMVVSLVNLDQPVEAHEHLTKALQYGEAPLGAKLHADGITYQKLLDGRLARLEVSCTEPGTKVSIDGQELLVGPGTATRVLLPGAHQVVASKDKFLARTESLILIGGKLETLKLEMIALEDATTTKRRWQPWKPWAVVGSGVGVGLVGALLYWRADADMKSYDAQIAALCTASGGCALIEIPEPVSAIERRAETESAAAIVSFGVAGAAIATGLVLVIMNQPRAVPVTDSREFDRQRTKSKMSLMPILSGEAAGLAATLRF